MIFPLWRTLLFIPVTNEKFVATAHALGADGIILDLEDAVLPELKSQARSSLVSAAASIHAYGTDVLVRINADSLEEDLEIACQPTVRALVVPKVHGPQTIIRIAELLDVFESRNGLQPGQIKLLIQKIKPRQWVFPGRCVFTPIRSRCLAGHFRQQGRPSLRLKPYCRPMKTTVKTVPLPLPTTARWWICL